VHFRTRDGTMKDPDVHSLLFATQHFMFMSWNEKGINIHLAKDILIEAWFLDQVLFVSEEEWEELMKKAEVEREKASSYVI
jgi:hypothetical protein